MNLHSIPMLAAIRAKMNWLTQRQDVISDNVSNSNTPGYRAKDLKPMSFQELINASSKVPASGRTHVGHMSLDSGAPKIADVVELDTKWETTPDGNSVVLEEQMMNVAQNQMEYQSAISLYRKSLDILRIAIRSPR